VLALACASAARGDDAPQKTEKEAAFPCCDADTGAAPSANVLRIADDPNNLPFSNERGEGFENKIADLVARELGKDVTYVWRAQRRGFFRETLKSGNADLVPGVPAALEMALPTKPYYRSTYVFVTRKDRGLKLTSFDDPRLRELKIGVQIVGDDGNNPPAAHALAARGITQNVVGYLVFGDYREDSPPARIVEAVAKGEIDAAVVWGPLAGYWAKKSAVPLELTPVPPKDERTGLPFAFAISMGVGKKNKELRDKLNEVLERKRPEIEAILDEYGVPRVESVPEIADDDDDGPPGGDGPRGSREDRR
jgi:mxaJ protein